MVEKTKVGKKKAFLAAYSETGNITRAAELSKCSRRQHYRWLADPAYAKEFAEAEEQAADRLEQEARRRAVEGTQKPVFYKGEQCGIIREYSDILLIFLLKGIRPEKYKERFASEHTGKSGGPIVVRNYENISDEELDQIIIEKTAAIEKIRTAGTD